MSGRAEHFFPVLRCSSTRDNRKETTESKHPLDSTPSNSLESAQIPVPNRSRTLVPLQPLEQAALEAVSPKPLAIVAWVEPVWRLGSPGAVRVEAAEAPEPAWAGAGPFPHRGPSPPR